MSFSAAYRVVKTLWFDLLIMFTIAAVGIGIGLGLSGFEEDSETLTLVNMTLDQITFFVFFFEAVLKIFSCGTRPWVYFMSEIMVITTRLISLLWLCRPFTHLTLEVLRLARLCRWFDFVEQVPEVNA